jgi:hypothetical protein
MHPLARARDRRGYVMLVAMVLLALLAVLGSSTLTIAGVDQRISLQNRKHMLVLNTSSAGNEHARDELRWTNPVSEGIDTGDTHDDFINATVGEADFRGLAYTHNLGVYWVSATYIRCGNPPPGYSTEVGRAGFRSDYWLMESTARMQDPLDNTNINETQAKTATVLRKVMDGSCRIR